MLPAKILTRQILRTFERHSLKKTEKTIDWVIDELLWRKHKSKIVNVFDGVAKSDTNISPELLQALKDATIPLVKPRQPERMAENEYQVFLDPSLRALSFRDTKTLLKETIKIHDCFLSVCAGMTLCLHDAGRSSPLPHMRIQTLPLGHPSRCPYIPAV